MVKRDDNVLILYEIVKRECNFLILYAIVKRAGDFLAPNDTVISEGHFLILSRFNKQPPPTHTHFLIIIM